MARALSAFAAAVAAALNASAAAAGSGACLLCGGEAGAALGAALEGAGHAAGQPPLEIELYSGFNFHRLPVSGAAGEMLVDSGHQFVAGESGLSGYGLVGRVVIRGAPNADIYVDLPRRIALVGRSGERIEIDRVTAALGPSPRLDSSGRLEFTFSGSLEFPAGVSPGDYRAAFTVDAGYQ
jgi:hypothetical protein